jgi:hypothetical protein
MQTQTTYTNYPQLIDNAGEIFKELQKLRRALRSFQSRMSPSTLRDHREARAEIGGISEKVRAFLNFHRHQISRYLTDAVQEGHRNLVKEAPRNRSNAAIFPLLELLDRLRDENLRLGSQFRAPLSGYTRLTDEVSDKMGYLDRINSIYPPQYLI